MEEVKVEFKKIRRFACLSDLHNVSYPSFKMFSKCESVFYAGDILYYEHNIEKGKEIIEDKFIGWAKTITKNGTNFIFVAGDHDLPFQIDKEWADRKKEEWKKFNIYYLQDEFIVLNGLKIYGTPWNLWNWDMAFNSKPLEMGGYEQLTEIYSKIPNDIDVLISHDAPAEVSGRYNYPLFKKLQKRNQNKFKFKLTVCGHEHEGYGCYRIGYDIVSNCSLLETGRNGRKKIKRLPMYYFIKGGKFVNMNKYAWQEINSIT